MDEKYLLGEIVKCRDKIKQLQAEEKALANKMQYLKEAYYQLQAADVTLSSLCNLNERICANGFIIGIMI